MATLYEYYNTGDDSRAPFYGERWRAQTFTPATAHKITSVKLKLYRLGSPGTITVGIRATDADGHPTGADLCSGTTNGNTLPTGSPYEWREITLGAGYDLSADVKYAIVVRALDGDGDNLIYWQLDSTDPTYPGGNYEYSNTGGSSWTSRTDFDFMFEDWGEPLVVELSGVSGGVASVSGAIAIDRTLAGVSQGVASVSGAVAIDRTLAGVVAGIATVSGNLQRLRELSGAIAGAAQVTGMLAIYRGLAGVVSGVATVSGRLGLIKWLSGVSAGVATVTGRLGRIRLAVRNLLAIRNLPAVRNLPPVR